MKPEQLEQILRIVRDDNPENFFINNPGLAEMGALLFYPKDSQKERGLQLLNKLKDALPNTYRDVLSSLQKYHLTSYYTPKQVIDYQIRMLKVNGFEPATILDPSSGNGAYVQELKAAFPNAKITALEPDLLSHSILAANNRNNPNVETINSTFEDFFLLNREKKEFDLVMTNIPFGDIPINSGHKHEYIQDDKLKNVGNYFNFYAPEITSIGGITSILTSKNFIDRSTYSHFRDAIVQNNNLITANRFNNTLFKSEGTKVVTDLLVYQKARNKDRLSSAEKDFIETTPFFIGDQLLHENLYFHNRTENINGNRAVGVFHQRPDLTITKNQETLEQFINGKIEKVKLRSLEPSKNEIINIRTVEPLPTPKIQDSPKTTEEISNDIQEPVEEKSGAYPPEGIPEPLVLHSAETQDETSLFTNNFNFDDRGNLFFYVNPERTRPVAKKFQEVITDYARLKNDIILLEANSRLDRITGDQIDAKFKDISYQLDTLAFKWQDLNSIQNYVQADAFHTRIKSLTESISKTTGTYGRNTDFTAERFHNLATPGIRLKKTPSPIAKIGKTDTIAEIPGIAYDTPFDMARDLFDTTGRIDEIRIAEKFRTSPTEVLNTGLSEKQFFLQPDSSSVNGYRTVPYFEFSSGDIEGKIDFLTRNDLPYGLNNKKAIDILAEHRNAKLDLKDIKFNFESHFIPERSKEQFLTELLKEPIKINKTQFSSSTNIIFSYEKNSEAHERFSVVQGGKTARGYKKILHNFAENKYPAIYQSIKRPDGSTYSVLNQTATIMAQNKYEELQLHFESFILSNIDIKKTIEDQYYRDFLAEVNVKVPPGWLTFPKTLVHSPYGHQIGGTLYSLTKGTSLMDHKVGMGKTLSMAMLAFKLQQHGRSKRSLLLTLKDIAPQVEEEIRSNFPQFTIHRLTSKQLAPSKIDGTLKYLKKNPQINLIIAEPTHLQKIAKKREYVTAIIGEKIDMIDMDMETAEEYGDVKMSKQIIKGLLKRKGNLEAKLATITKKLDGKKGSVITLSDLNIDSLLVDEAHGFKNISYTTRHQNVSGLNQSVEQTKNLDLEVTIRSIHDRVGDDKNIFFVSGTPILNSVTELYAYQRYLTPRALKDKGISNFDAWASIFLKQTAAIEPDTFGRPRLNSRFRYFTNMPELSKMYHSFTHVVDQKTFATHDLELDQEFVTLEASENFKKLQELTTEFVRTKNQNILYRDPKYSAEELKAATILALTLNRSLLVDPLSQPNVKIDFSEVDQHKIFRLCKDVAQLYESTTPDKGGMLIFSDLNVWKQGEYNTYDTVKKILVDAYNIPGNEIAFMQQAKKTGKGSQLQADVRDGKVRIAIGSTQTMGTGTNIQKRLVGVFHLDIPYSPDKFEQRIGRALRSGNMVAPKYGNKIINRMYGMKNTADIFSYSLNTHKQKFIVQLKDADPNVRTYDDSVPSDKELSYAQMQAALIGDMEAFTLVKLENDLKYLETQKKLFDITKANSFKRIEQIEKSNKDIISQIGELQAFLPHAKPFVLGSDFEKNSNAYKEEVAGPLLSFIKNADTPLSFLRTDDPLEIYRQVNRAIMERSQFHGNRTNQRTIFEMPKIGVHVVMAREFQNHTKTYAYKYGLKFKNIEIFNRLQNKIDDHHIPNHIVKLLQEIPKTIAYKKGDMKYNLRHLDSNRENVKMGFPEGKISKIDTLKKDINGIKRKRGHKI